MERVRNGDTRTNGGIGRSFRAPGRWSEVCNLLIGQSFGILRFLHVQKSSFEFHHFMRL